MARPIDDSVGQCRLVLQATLARPSSIEVGGGFLSLMTWGVKTMEVFVATLAIVVLEVEEVVDILDVSSDWLRSRSIRASRRV